MLRHILPLLALFCSLSAHAVSLPAALSDEERAWLKAHPTLRIGIDPDWAPFEYLDDQQRYRGMAADYVALLSKKLGVKMVPVEGLSWSGVLDAAKNKRLDVLPAAMATSQREQYLNFTAPYLDFPMVIITRDDAPFISSLEALSGQRVAVVQNYVSHELLESNHPKLTLILSSTINEALTALSDHSVDAFVGNLASITHTINQQGLSNLKVAAHTPYSFKLGMGVRNDWPELVTILDKTMSSLSTDEVRQIQQLWTGMHPKHAVDLVKVAIIVIPILLAAFLVVMVVIRNNRKLRNEIHERQQIEKRLLLSEEALLDSQAITHIGNYVWEITADKTSWSQELYRIVGRSAENFQPSYENYLSCIHPEDRENFTAFTSCVLEQQEPYNAEYRVVRPGGNVRHVRETGKVFRNDAGEPLRLVGVIHDITKSKNIELALQEKQQTLQTILDTAPIGIWLQDISGKLRFVNRAFCDSVGISEQQFLSVPHYADLYTDEAAASCMRSDAEALAMEEVHTSYETVLFVDDKPHELEIFKSRLIDDQGYIVGLVGLSVDITERKQAEEKLRKQAFCDELTDLPNRNYFMVQLGKTLAQSRRHNYLSALLFFDLDNFKTINDSLGHHTGDKLLTEVGKRLSRVVRQEDTAARLGGDEFVIIAANLGSDPEHAADEARLIAEKVHKILSRPFTIDKHEHHLTMSTGINLFPMNGEDSNDILKFADTAMYRAKEGGRNTIRFFQPSMQRAAEERFTLQEMLRQALMNEEFELHYQPQFMADGKIIGAESLLRWHQPELGMISPARFIPLAEESGMILNIGIWVLREACNQITAWLQQGIDIETLAVNVSPRQFHQPDFVSQVQSIIRESGVDPTRLELELTEGVLVENIHDVNNKMEQLQQMGIRFAIDDFGTGYSSLRYLKQLPLDRLKIDQSFVRDIHITEANALIVETIISMAHHLELELIAEGVETIDELNFLKIRGCNKFQGYYFSKPLPEAQLSKTLLARLHQVTQDAV